MLEMCEKVIEIKWRTAHGTFLDWMMKGSYLTKPASSSALFLSRWNFAPLQHAMLIVSGKAVSSQLAVHRLCRERWSRERRVESTL